MNRKGITAILLTSLTLVLVFTSVLATPPVIPTVFQAGVTPAADKNRVPGVGPEIQIDTLNSTEIPENVSTEETTAMGQEELYPPTTYLSSTFSNEQLDMLNDLLPKAIAALLSTETRGIQLNYLYFDGKTMTVDLSKNARELMEKDLATYEELLQTIDNVTNSIFEQNGLSEQRSFDYSFLIDGAPILESLPAIPMSDEATESIQGKKVIISPGHGRYDNGGSWPFQRPEYYGLREDLINSTLVTELQNKLAWSAITRPTRQLSQSAGSHSSGYAWWEMDASEYVRNLGAPYEVWNGGLLGISRDIMARPRYGNWVAGNAMISIHNNGGGGCGTETWYDTGNGYQAQSQQLAALIQSKLISRLRARWNPNWCDRGVKGSNGGYGENRYFNGPAVIVELAFMDNEYNNSALKNAWFRAIATGAINDAILEYFGGCAPNYYKAEYFGDRYLSSSKLTFTRCERDISWNWGNYGPGNGVSPDNFSVRWSGPFTFYSGSQSFSAYADDGVRAWIDNTMIIDGWRDQAPTNYSALYNPGGGTHNVRVEYYEAGGGALGYFTWYYNILASHSNKCVDVRGASTSNGAEIIQWSCNGGDNQSWILYPNGTGYYQIKSRISGKCIDVNGGSTADGANILQWDCHGGDNQLWGFVAYNGKYKLVAKHSNKCLDVLDASTSDGAKLIQWSCYNGTNQLFGLYYP